MKKVLACILVAIMIVTAGAFFGCGKSKGLNMAAKMMYLNASGGADEYGNQLSLGVGRAVNALTDTYIEVSSKYEKVFDDYKLLDMKWVSSPMNKMEVKATSGNNMSEYSNYTSEAYSASISGKKSAGLFTATMSAKFDYARDLTVNTTTNEIFYSQYQNWAGNVVEIEGYKNVSKFSSVLSNTFLADVERVESGALTPEMLFELYGTHVLCAGIYGGRLECSYYLRTDTSSYDKNNSSNYALNIGAAIGSYSGKSSTTGSIASSLGLSDATTAETFRAEGKGGKSFAAMTPADFQANYSAWAESFNEDSKYNVLIDIPEKSLISVWDLLPESKSAVKDTISAAFEQLATNAQSEFLSRYYRTLASDLGNVTDYAGGDGSTANPYKLATRAHVENINLHRSSSFRLVDDIDMGTDPFIPIGYENGNYSSFSGVLDGDGYSINNLKITLTLKNKSDWSYCGLFCILEGEVKNLILSGVDINPKLNTSPYYNTNVGSIAGYIKTSKAKISYCSVFGTVSLINKVDVRAYVGGIVGSAGESAIVSNCINYARVTCDTTDEESFCGGITGAATSSTINLCSNKGLLQAGGYISYIGGIAASGKNATLNKCTNTGSYKFLATSIFGKNYGKIVARDDNCTISY